MRKIFPLAALLVSTATPAAVLNYTFQGQILRDFGEIGPVTIQEGDSYSLNYVIDRNDIDGAYNVLSTSLTIEGFSTAEMHNPKLDLFDNVEDCDKFAYCIYEDELDFGGTSGLGDLNTPKIDGYFVRSVNVDLLDYDGLVLLDTTSLPATLGLNDFEYKIFSVTLGTDTEQFGDTMRWTGSVDSVAITAVPIPAAVWLFGSALAGLGWLRRKQHA